MFAEDLGAFFDIDDGFAELAVSGATEFAVIMLNPQADVLGIETSGPSCRARTADVAALQHGSAIALRGATWFVVGVQPDGTGPGGTTVLSLRKAA